MKSLGLLISDPPGSGPFGEGLVAASDALVRGEWVGLYLLDEAVQGVGNSDLAHLRTQGLHVFACSQAALVFGVTMTAEVIFGGLSLLGELIAKVSCFAHASRFGTVMHTLTPGSAERIRRVLMRVTGDPRSSHKPAESVRVGIGLGAWSQVEVNFCFEGQSARVFADDWTGLVSEDALERFVPSLWDWPRPLYLLSPPTDALGKGKGDGRFGILTSEELCRLVAEHDVVVRL